MRKYLFLSLVFLNLFSLVYSQEKLQEKTIDQHLYNSNPELKELLNKKNNLLNSLGVEGELVISPKFYSSLQYIFLKDRNESSLLIAESSKLGSLELGIKKVNQNGSYFKLGHNQSSLQANSSQFLNVTDFSYTDPKNVTSFSGSPFFTFGLPLLSGRGGNLIKRDIDLLELRDKIELFSLDAEMITKEIELKNLIWDYSLKKQLISKFLDSQKRITKLSNVIKRKVDARIEEPGSLYQVDAVLKSNEIEIQNYDKDLKEISDKLKMENLDDFNLFENDLLNRPNLSGVQQNDNNLSIGSVLKLTDLKQRMNQNEKSAEESKASLDLILSANYKNENSNYLKAQSNSFKAKRPEYLVGLNFSMDLDRDLLSKKRQKNELVYKNEGSLFKIIKDNDFKEKNITQNKINNELIILTSLEKLRNIQKLKLDNELRLLNLGRSNLFQVLQFENEYTRSEQSYFYQLVSLKNLEEQYKNYRFKLE